MNVRGVADDAEARRPRAARDGGAIVVTASMNSWPCGAGPGLRTRPPSTRCSASSARRRSTSAPSGIRVNAVGPGPVATDAFRERLARREAEGGLPADEALRQAAAGTALGRLVTEDDVARAALFLACDLSSGVSGALLPVDAGLR